MKNLVVLSFCLFTLCLLAEKPADKPKDEPHAGLQQDDGSNAQTPYKIGESQVFLDGKLRLEFTYMIGQAVKPGTPTHELPLPHQGHVAGLVANIIKEKKASKE